jgi:transposase-like protein
MLQREISKTVLDRLYTRSERTVAEIAQELDVTVPQLYKLLDLARIPRRQRRGRERTSFVVLDE